MTSAAAVEFLDRAEQDDAFAADLATVKDDPNLVLAKVRSYGFDVTPEEIRDAFLERYGVELTAEQLEAIAAGGDDIGLIVSATTGGVLGVAAIVGVCAAFAL
jgi:hypothetical protein